MQSLHRCNAIPQHAENIVKQVVLARLAHCIGAMQSLHRGNANLRYVLWRTLAHNGSLDWNWAEHELQERLQRIKDRREAREAVAAEMAGLQPMAADENL